MIRIDWRHIETGEVIHLKDVIAIEEAFSIVQGELMSMWALFSYTGWELRIYRLDEDESGDGE